MPCLSAPPGRRSQPVSRSCQERRSAESGGWTWRRQVRPFAGPRPGWSSAPRTTSTIADARLKCTQLGDARKVALLVGHYETFFAASAGASAAILGLLVVAVSVVNADDEDAKTRERRTVLAGSAFLALVDAFFFVSIVALTGGAVVFGIANLVMALVGLLCHRPLIRRAKQAGTLFLPRFSNSQADTSSLQSSRPGLFNPTRPRHRAPRRLSHLRVAARSRACHRGVVRKCVGAGMGGHRDPAATLARGRRSVAAAASAWIRCLSDREGRLPLPVAPEVNGRALPPSASRCAAPRSREAARRTYTRCRQGEVTSIDVHRSLGESLLRRVSAGPTCLARLPGRRDELSDPWTRPWKQPKREGPRLPPSHGQSGVRGVPHETRAPHPFRARNGTGPEARSAPQR